MRLIATALLLSLGLALCCADSPFPDSKKNHWVYVSMRAIRKEHLWYRANDAVPKRDVPTRLDVATKAMFLAIDSPGLIDSFQKTTRIASQIPDNAQTKKWAKQFATNFPAKKNIYKTHLERVTKLWKFFKSDMPGLAKAYKVDPNVIVKRLALARWKLDHTQLRKPVAMIPHRNVPADHLAARTINNLKREVILVGYPATSTMEITD